MHMVSCYSENNLPSYKENLVIMAGINYIQISKAILTMYVYSFDDNNYGN